MAAFYLILHIRFLNGGCGAPAAEWAQEQGEHGLYRSCAKMRQSNDGFDTNIH
jgi:hypothetical protein